MPKKPQALLSLPPQVQQVLRQLGEDLTIARKRGESQGASGLNELVCRSPQLIEWKGVTQPLRLVSMPPRFG